jgi:hypothetical protein
MKAVSDSKHETKVVKTRLGRATRNYAAQRELKYLLSHHHRCVGQYVEFRLGIMSCGCKRGGTNDSTFEFSAVTIAI